MGMPVAVTGGGMVMGGVNWGADIAYSLGVLVAGGGMLMGKIGIVVRAFVNDLWVEGQLISIL